MALTPVKNRFIFVNGTWQLCMVVAALRQEQVNKPLNKYHDFLIIYTRSKGVFHNPELVQYIIRNNTYFWDWHDVAEFDWMPNEWNQEIRHDKQKMICPLLELFSFSNISMVNELWLCKIQFLQERLFADIFYHSKLVLYEDGLHTYLNTPYLVNLPSFNIKQPLKTISQYKIFVKDYIQHNFDWHSLGVKRNHLSRVKKFYSVLGHKLEIPTPINRVQTKLVNTSLLQAFFIELHEKIGHNLDFQRSSNEHKKIALFLGSNLNHMQSFPREVEVEIFRKAIQRFKGKYLILWKEHPRCNKPIFLDIKERIDSETVIYQIEEQMLPIEIFASKYKIEICCSTLSSSLFYLNYIYDIKAFTCVRPLMNFLNNDFLKLARLTCANVEDVFEVSI